MDDQRFFNVIALLAAVVVLASFGAGYAGSALAPPAAAGSPAPGSASPTVVYLTISTLPSGADQYLPGNFTVPEGQVVTFVISSYDNGVNNLDGSLSTVMGTIGGTESVSGGAPGTPQGAVSTFATGDTTHTFSIMSPGAHLNAVVPPAADPSIPVQVTFSVVFHTAGTLSWMCMAPCDSGSMGSTGYMSGTITVV